MPQLRVRFARKPGWKKLKWTAPLSLASHLPRCLVSYANTVSHYSKSADREAIFSPSSRLSSSRQTHGRVRLDTSSLFLVFPRIFGSLPGSRTLAAPRMTVIQLRNALQWLANGDLLPLSLTAFVRWTLRIFYAITTVRPGSVFNQHHDGNTQN